MAWPTVNIDITHMDAGTDSPATARADIKQMADNVNGIKDARGSANGVAPLDGGSQVPAANLPITPANKGGTGQAVYGIGDVLYANSTTTLTKLSPGAAGYALTSNGPGSPLSYQQVGGFAPGTRLSFNQSAAPTGWTKDTTAALNDSIMRIVTGAVGSGGATAFSTFNGQVSVGATTLSIAQMPSHNHPYITWRGSSNASRITGNYSYINTIQPATPTTAQGVAPQGGGGSHTHSVTNDIKYNDFIVAEKA